MAAKGKIAGFKEAAEYVGAQEGKTVELLNVPYANSFSDAPKGKEFATELINQGADVFFGDASAVDCQPAHRRSSRSAGRWAAERTRCR